MRETRVCVRTSKCEIVCMGCDTLQVSFAKEPYKNDDLMQKTSKCEIVCRRILSYGVATASRLLNIIGLFCKRAL